jgi:APA family basic amino acid/polyamine antiporter
MKKETNPGFRKSLNLFDSTAIVIGSMIGSGIFIVSCDVARTLGSPGWLMITWLITGIMTIIAALSYGELAGMMPRAGGQYVYLRQAYNPLFGFLYGWTLFLVIQTGTIAAVAMAFAKYSGVLFPWISEKNVWMTVGSLKFNTVHIIAVSSIALLTWINMHGIKQGKVIQNFFTSTKVLVILVLIVFGFLLMGKSNAGSINSGYFWNAVSTKNGVATPLTGLMLLTAIGTAMVGTIFTSDAWNNVTFTGSEIINPKRNIPLSLFFGTLIVTCIYLVINYIYIQLMPLRGNPEGLTVFERGIQFATNDRLGSSVLSIPLGEIGAVVMAAFIMISTFGCNNGLILSGSRVYYSMAQDGLFFKKTGNLNSKGVPAAALIIQGIWASMLCLSGSYSQLLDYVVFAVLIFYVLTIAGIYILRKKQPDAERPYKAFGYPVLPAIYIIAAILLMLDLLIYKPDFTWPGLIIVCMGIPVYYIWKAFKRN